MGSTLVPALAAGLVAVSLVRLSPCCSRCAACFAMRAIRTPGARRCGTGFYALDWGDTATNNYGFAPADEDHPQRFQRQMYRAVAGACSKASRGREPALQACSRSAAAAAAGSTRFPRRRRATLRCDRARCRGERDRLIAAPLMASTTNCASSRAARSTCRLPTPASTSCSTSRRRTIMAIARVVPGRGGARAQARRRVPLRRHVPRAALCRAMGRTGDGSGFDARIHRYHRQCRRCLPARQRPRRRALDPEPGAAARRGSLLRAPARELRRGRRQPQISPPSPEAPRRYLMTAATRR